MADQPGIPVTRIPVSAEREAAIRGAVCMCEVGPQAGQRLARPEDAAGLTDFLKDPRIHAPIYSLPKPLTVDNVAGFIADHVAERELGEGLLFVTDGGDGRIVGYSDFQIWPKWAAGELAGALHPDLQSKGQGGAGAAQSFSWMFETLGLDLICETAAPDNVRTARLLDAAGFERRGEVTSVRPDGTTRSSLVWEMSRQRWQSRSEA